MSVASGYRLIKVPIKPSGQTTGQWTGSNVNNPITYLDRGVYNITYNCVIQPSVGTLTSVLGIITENALYPQAGYNELVSSARTGTQGTGGGVTPISFSIQNNIVIQNDNTPIFLYMIVALGGGTTWGVPLGQPQYNDYMNYICIVPC
jgi:hypothetical protein